MIAEYSKLVRMHGPDGSDTRIPDDIYDPVTHYVPFMPSAPDSIAMGHWTWKTQTLGFLGRVSRIMLHSEWEDALESEEES
jgi:hypothetical protein